MSVMDINEAAIMVLRDHLGTGVYDDHFFENVEKILSIFNGEEINFPIEKKEEEPTIGVAPKKANPFKNYKI